MRRTIIVLIISTVLLWGSAALGRRSPTTRWDGDPDEYQATAVHDEKNLKTWISSRYSGGHKRTSRVASEPGVSDPGVSGESRSRYLGRLLWEILFPGKKQRCSGEGR